MITAPHISSPINNNQFNLGVVAITWDIPTLYSGIGIATGDPYDPYRYSLAETTKITHEIEYTDNYQGEDTVWFTLRRRIPFTDTSYDWKVGKMIKSSKVRIRMRTKHLGDELESEWSISEAFSINVFNLIAPAIINPVSNILYTDFILIILDETLTKNTYHQKVRYTLEYSSDKQSIGWTKIITNVPTGQNVIRWNIESLPTSDDYILKLTARNVSSCLESPVSDPDQIDRNFIYNINIQQSGVFLIDTVPPEAVLQISGNENVTNEINQVLEIFAEDETTKVKHIQIRECNASNELSLGDLADPIQGDGCPPLVLDGSVPFDRIISDKHIGDLSKVQWTFNAEDADGNPLSAVKKLEALLTDIGGNNSLQIKTRTFLSIFSSDSTLNDFIITIEQREKVEFGNDGTRTISTAVFEVVYIGTINGQLWILEPFARLIYTISESPSIEKIYEFNDLIFIFTYNESSDTSRVYRHDSSEATLLNTFTSALAKVTGVFEFSSAMYMGMSNGELWKYNGTAFSLVNTFTNEVSTLYGDSNYLYIGFSNSSNMFLYDGTDFIELDIE